MRRRASVQVRHSALYAMVICLPVIDEISRRRSWRNIVAWAIDQLSESFRNLVDVSDIQIEYSWHEPEALDHLTGGDVKAHPRWVHAALSDLREPLWEGTT